MIYYGEDTDVYIEDLESGAQQWEVAKPLPERRGLPARAAKPDSFNPAHFGVAAGRKPTYVEMALEVRMLLLLRYIGRHFVDKTQSAVTVVGVLRRMCRFVAAVIFSFGAVLPWVESSIISPAVRAAFLHG